MKTSTAVVVIIMMILVALVLTAYSPSSQSTSSMCESGLMQLHDDGTAECIPKYKGE